MGENNMQAPQRIERGHITRKMFIRIIVLFIVLTVGISAMILLNPIIKGWSAYKLGRPQECTATAIRNKTEVRNSTNYTTFVTESGYEYEVESSYKDYVGRKTTLLLYRDKACRQNYEIPKLTTLHIIMVLLLVLCWGTLIICLITKKITIVKE